ILIFELQLEFVKTARNAKNRKLKSIENCTDSTILKRAKKFKNNALKLLKSASQNCYSNKDYISIKAINYSALDKTQVSQEGYRHIATVNSTIPCEGAISNECVLLNKQMEANIKITQINLYHLEVEKDSTDAFEQGIIDKIDKIGAQCSIKDLLNYIILYLEQSNILKCTDLVVHLRISGDGQNVGHKIKHTMVTFMILNDIKHYDESDFQYTVVLYPETEKYEILKFVLSTLIEDLWFLKKNGLQIGTLCWNFEFYFSADLKFFSICFSLNATNSTYFCSWYNINKNQYENTQADWRITKTMEQLILNWNNMNRHIRAPLFDIIPLENWICDELYILLQIYDRLWELIIAELKARKLYNDKFRKIIVDEMKRINVTFQFWKNYKTHNWNYTFLMDKDKLKVLQSFNFGVLFCSSRTKLIH
ncbi:33932_t:CDS:2, partial [Gigaspora margarita]